MARRSLEHQRDPHAGIPHLLTWNLRLNAFSHWPLSRPTPKFFLSGFRANCLYLPDRIVEFPEEPSTWQTAPAPRLPVSFLSMNFP